MKSAELTSGLLTTYDSHVRSRPDRHYLGTFRDRQHHRPPVLYEGNSPLALKVQKPGW